MTYCYLIYLTVDAVPCSEHNFLAAFTEPTKVVARLYNGVFSESLPNNKNIVLESLTVEYDIYLKIQHGPYQVVRVPLL